ncbi:MAG: ricin-type beta-trefoil lectin domain protein [Streptosporangiaceae bacterium]
MTALLTAGAITAGVTAASANTAGFCSASGTKATCTETQKINSPDTITVAVTLEQGTSQDATVAWTATCSLAGQTAATKGGSTSTTPVTDALTLPFTDPDSCTVSATGTLSGTGQMLVDLTYTPAASPSPTPSPTPTSSPAPEFRGYGGKCLDDAGNGSADRTKIQIWTCNSRDKAQGWTYHGGELIHNGKCANDQRFGGNGSKVILYTCNGASNEIWTHHTNGELVLKANGGKYCLDDPAYSTRNGTQLIVYSCKDSANQRWHQA